jgi:hypothetical protein
MRIVVEVRDLVQRIRDGHTSRVLNGRMIERSGDAVCGLHRARGDEEHMFLGWASKPWSTVCQWFDLKTIGTVCQWFDLKINGTISPGLISKPVALVSPDLASKPGWRVFRFGLKINSYSFLIWDSKSPRRFLSLSLKTKRATVYRLRHKTDGRMKTTHDTRRDLKACFVWKQVGLVFSSLISRLTVVQR